MFKILFILSLIILFIPCIGIAECEYIILHEYDTEVMQEKVKEYLRNGWKLESFSVYHVYNFQTLTKDCNQ